MVLRGFPRNTDTEVIVAKLAEYKEGALLNIVSWDYNSKGKSAWGLMKAMAGKKFEIDAGGEKAVLWHGSEKIPPNRCCRRRACICTSV